MIDGVIFCPLGSLELMLIKVVSNDIVNTIIVTPYASDYW